MARNQTEAGRKRDAASKRDGERRKPAPQRSAKPSLLPDRERGHVSPLGGVATRDERWRK
jgi:hypothetical protein